MNDPTRALLDALFGADVAVMAGTVEEEANLDALREAVRAAGLPLAVFARGREFRVIGSADALDALTAALLEGGAHEAGADLLCDWTDEGEA